MSLEGYRKKIDELDCDILSKLEERMRVAEKIARVKKEEGLPIENLLREKELMNGILEKSSPDLVGYNRILYNTIFELSKDHQRKVINEESVLIGEIRKAMESTSGDLPQNPVVACQGIQGAYSQEACEKLFKMPKIMYVENFSGVFSAIESGLCQYGILPLENSSAGSVNQVYNLMMEYDFHIVRSIKLKINHYLLALPGVKASDIKEIISHPQALAQCEEYLRKYPNARITECENTAIAAKRVSESRRSDFAAIGSEENGRLYGLNTLDDCIQDRENNYTRFIAISKKLEIYPGANKTSLMMVLDHKPGALYNVLARFNAMGINLEKLESRPLPERDFEFMFYFDIQESVYSEEFVRMINQLEEISREFKYLGSYLDY